MTLKGQGDRFVVPARWDNEPVPLSQINFKKSKHFQLISVIMEVDCVSFYNILSLHIHIYS